MKKMILLILLSCALQSAQAQRIERLRFATSIGTGVAMSKPESTPFAWQVLGYYVFNRCFSAGVGSGISCYEKTMIPVFADAKFMIARDGKFIPYLEYAIGYSFAPDKNANGGLYMYPSVGIQYSLFGKHKLFLALGYELQALERLKVQHQQILTVEFLERLKHHSITAKIGFIF